MGRVAAGIYTVGIFVQLKASPAFIYVPINMHKAYDRSNIIIVLWRLLHSHHYNYL